jgi:hypothetical protein
VSLFSLVILLSICPIDVSHAQFCRDADFDGFLAGDNCGSPADCNDQHQDTNPDASESCNGWDDDCDGETDEGCDRSCDSLQVVARRTIRQAAHSPLIENAERGWVVSLGDGSDTDTLAVMRVDRMGVALAPLYEYTRSWPRKPYITWSGRTLYVAWTQIEPLSDDGVYARGLGGWGRADSETVTVAQVGSNSHIAWTGGNVAIPWLQVVGSNQQHSHTLSLLDENLAPNDSTQFSDTTAYNSRMDWSGSGFGWVYSRQSSITNHQELYFQRLAPDGTVLVPEKLITDHQAFGSQAAASSPRIVSRGPGQGFGVAWLDSRTYPWQIWFEIVDDQGNVLAPGAVQASNAVIASVEDEIALTWSGSEFLLIWTNSDQSQIGIGKLIATRISSAGVVLERRQITNGPADNAPDAAWDGHGYGVVFNHYLPAQDRNDVDFLRIGCSCSTDADGDGRLPCAGGDCDDSNPNVTPGRVEQCSDGLDNDCDGSADCFDSECSQGGAPPAEVLGLELASDEITISWVAVAGAASYDILRGFLTDLQPLGNISWALCKSHRQLPTSWTDASIPFAGDGYYYLVRARGSGCLRGTWGTSARDSTARECP